MENSEVNITLRDTLVFAKLWNNEFLSNNETLTEKIHCRDWQPSEVWSAQGEPEKNPVLWMRKCRLAPLVNLE